LYTGRLYQVPACGGQIPLKMGVVTVTWPILNFQAPIWNGRSESPNLVCR